ncbi:hypothetical protein [Minwuia sp.]|uniref:hypothetical protein n=1 Tax=Minwuia sp. TaxID=2493630 RepID=UPI003A8ECC21
MYLRVNEQRVHASVRSAIGGENIAPCSLREADRRLTYDPYAAGLGRQNVPRVFVKRIPKDLGSVQSVAEAQKHFVRLMLPVALRANETLSLQRSMMRAASDERVIEEEMWHYDATDAEQLDRRFDISPPSLIIALAAAATNWGRDHRAIDSGMIFPDAISTPADLPPSVAKASDGLRRTHHHDLLGPVLDALHGLNTVPGGAALRRERARQRQRRRFDGYRLALLLSNIDGITEKHVRDTLYAIEGGALTRLDTARLEAPGAVFH